MIAPDSSSVAAGYRTIAPGRSEFSFIIIVFIACGSFAKRSRIRPICFGRVAPGCGNRSAGYRPITERRRILTAGFCISTKRCGICPTLPVRRTRLSDTCPAITCTAPAPPAFFCWFFLYSFHVSSCA